MDIFTNSSDGGARLRDVLHRINNYLASVVTSAETALARDDAAAMRRALEKLVSESRNLEIYLKEIRRDVDS